MTEAPPEITRAELEELLEKYRNVKHDINNSLAVILALSELSQRNPAHFQKLAKTVLDRGPGIVEMLQDFQMLLTAKVKGGPVAQTPPSSGVF
jgi:DNA invertase Pin-like site-specific DNA recombinase